MYCIVRTGGRQFRVEAGQTLDVERMPTREIGESFTLNEVLLVGNGETTVIGQPLVEGASVAVTVVDQFRGDKVIVFKYRQRTSYRRMRGHRHYHTRLQIDAINA